ncbi:MAG TPA: ATP-binding protein [Actinomycetota bacterium]|nr:ATP-binding protein [Actinomycetota bacterium]
MRPLDPLSSIKVKLGVVIVAAVVVTIVTVAVGVGAGYNLFAGGLAAGVLALAMVQFLARGMTSPLREMADAARAMARGDYDRRVTATSRDEVGELARVFNQMASELAEVDRMRKDLIANVSHELRTPIAALQATLENLVDGVEDSDPATLKVMVRQVERLGSLVSQLLDLSRLESGAVPLRRRRFALRPLLAEVVEEAETHERVLQDRGVTISLSVEPDELEINADPERVHQVIANLIQNALRHSPHEAPVEVAARETSDAVVIEVADRGPGIPDEDAARVFERFYRSDEARASATGGTGLGLSIARWVVDLHGGEIRAERRAPTGCRMIVELPATERHNASPHPAI